MITLSINIDLVDKKKFFQGKKGRYLNLVLFETPDSKYGDYMVKQDQNKAERQSGEKTPILGNAKIFEGKGNNTRRAPNEEQGGDDW